MKEKNVLYPTRFLIFFFASLLLFTFLAPQFSHSQDIPDDKKEVFSNSGLPIPRFVSLAKETTNVRAGPGQKYPVKWVVKMKSLPVEVILEYDHWRKIKDHEGAEGWVFKSLLSGKRMGIIQGDEPVKAYDHNFEQHPEKYNVSMMLEPMSLVKIDACMMQMCRVSVSGLYGWIERKSLWGVYEQENFD